MRFYKKVFRLLKVDGLRGVTIKLEYEAVKPIPKKLNGTQDNTIEMWYLHLHEVEVRDALTSH